MINTEESYNYHNVNIGKMGEECACKYLKQLNYNIITRNFYSKMGEIDIIAMDKDEYVFIEVKTRISRKYGNPIEAINYYKKQHIVKAATCYMYINFLKNKKIRFDVIEVYFYNKNSLINHIKNVFN